MTRVARHNTEAEIAALEAFCDTLNRFGADLALEWLDGWMTAIAASRRPIGIDEWLPRLCGDDFDRAFADPESAAQAKATLMTRFQALTSQLDAESIAEDPETLRLSPLMVQYDNAVRAEIVAAGHMAADEAAEDLLTGALWAEGFYEAVEAFADDWPDADDNDPDAAWYDDALSRVMLLALPQSELDIKIREFFPDDPPSRDELVDEACWSVQDLRLYWVDHAPKPATRRVEPTPGRNDPCPCGSGKKYKKCHGAATAD